MSDKAPAGSPYQMKESDKTGKGLTPTTKSYYNQWFLESRDARIVRIMAEFIEPSQRLNACGIKGTILFFGSARAMLKGDFVKTLHDLTLQAAATPAGEEREKVETRIASFRKLEWMCEWAEKTRLLAQKITEWSKTCAELHELVQTAHDYVGGHSPTMFQSPQPLTVLTGGGPGIMEAANRGAVDAAGHSVGMGITLPFEKGLNPYVTEGLAFEFNYFFTRKFWMMYSAKALVVGPGGVGTMDELFEILTLVQTGKLSPMPIVLLGASYWKTVINFQALADFGTISQSDVDKLFFTDDVEVAFNYLTEKVLTFARDERAKRAKTAMGSPRKSN
jgi:uncharacterized protein (TIGR00730 family)